jgi:hypothetical protein
LFNLEQICFFIKQEDGGLTQDSVYPFINPSPSLYCFFDAQSLNSHLNSLASRGESELSGSLDEAIRRSLALRDRQYAGQDKYKANPSTLQKVLGDVRDYYF